MKPTVQPVTYSDANCTGCGERIWPGYNFDRDEYPNAFEIILPSKRHDQHGVYLCHDCMMELQAAILRAHVARFDIMEGVTA